MDAIAYNFAHFIAISAQTSKTGEVSETRDFTLTSSGAPVAFFNQGLLKRPDVKLERTLERVSAFQARTKVPLCIQLDARHADAAQALQRHGATEMPSVPGMVLERIAELPVARTQLTVRRVEDAAGLELFGRIAFESFGYPLEFAPLTFTAELLAMPHVELLVGYVDDGGARQPACCSLLLVTGHVAGIHWVGTRAPYRTRGLGAAITAHAARAGAARGCTLASLQASPMGAPVYRRMGFVETHRYARYELPYRP